MDDFVNEDLSAPPHVSSSNVEDYTSSEDRLLLNLGFRAVVSGALYPFEYGKTLMQLGYEPINPWPAKSMTGKQKMMLPNIFQYVGHMSKREGKWALYRGVKLRVTEVVVSHIAHHMAIDYLFPDEKSDEEKNDEERVDDDVPEQIRREKYCKQFLRDLVGRTAAMIISHPLHVCSVRVMAEFIGGEKNYNGVFRSLCQLYRENGISGFFSGLVPRLLGELFQLALWHSLTYAFTTYVVKDKESKQIITTGMGFVASTICYPFIVVSKCMCVSGSGLAAGQPPCMPMYTSWVDCWSHLSRTDELWRASSMVLWRYDTRPFRPPGSPQPLQIKPN